MTELAGVREERHEGVIQQMKISSPFDETLSNELVAHVTLNGFCLT